MILVDTAIWVSHLRSHDATMLKLLSDGQVLMHPFVMGELALGYLNPSDGVLATLREMPQAELADNVEVVQFIGDHKLYGLGVGYVDVHLLTSTLLTHGSSLWTTDKRLHAAAEKLGLAADIR